MAMNRRQMLRAAAGAGLLVPAALGRSAFAQQGRTPRVLYFTKSAGFQHSVVARQGDQLAFSERILTEIGKQNGFEVVASKDGRLFNPDQIGQWDAFAFYTTGDLTQPGNDKSPPMSPEGKQAFLDAVRDGKGFLGIHSATDSFHSQGDQVDPYIRLIGGEFSGHDKQQAARIEVTDREFPGAAPFGASFELMDEWYAQKNLNDDLHVIMVQITKGMEGPNYHRPNFPMTWARKEGDGRVLYTAMGHREDVWENPKFQGLLIGGLKWVTGQVDADVPPNVQKVTPGYQEVARR